MGVYNAHTLEYRGSAYSKGLSSKRSSDTVVVKVSETQDVVVTISQRKKKKTALLKSFITDEEAKKYAIIVTAVDNGNLSNLKNLPLGKYDLRVDGTTVTFSIGNKDIATYEVNEDGSLAAK